MTDTDKEIVNIHSVPPPGEIEGAGAGRHSGVTARFWGRKLAKAET